MSFLLLRLSHPSPSNHVELALGWGFKVHPIRDQLSYDLNPSVVPGAVRSASAPLKSPKTSFGLGRPQAIVATVSDDQTWKVWSVPNCDLLMSGEGHRDWISCVTFHHHGTMLATGAGDNTVKIWDFLKVSKRDGRRDRPIGEEVPVHGLRGGELWVWHVSHLTNGERASLPFLKSFQASAIHICYLHATRVAPCSTYEKEREGRLLILLYSSRHIGIIISPHSIERK